jgi:hypothetical protein
MTESDLDELRDLDDPADRAERPEATGVERVDAVLDGVAGASGLALAEQVAVFEQAHAELRRALDDPGAAGSV